MVPDSDPLKIFAAGLFDGHIALAFARFGANVVIAGRSRDKLEIVADEIAASGAECLAVPTNIRETEAVDTLLEETVNRFGGLDSLVNNAGGQFPASPSQISDGGWRAVIDLNLNGTWNMCSRFGPHMAERGSGSIV